MSSLETLNNIDHQDLRVASLLDPAFGHNSGLVLVFPSEFADLQREYPILLQQQPGTGQFRALALLGLQPDENLFLRDGRWLGRYLPAIVAKGPFVIGLEDQSLQGGEENALVVKLDMADPRVNHPQGQRLFLEFGGNTPYLEQVNATLNRIYQGDRISGAMYKAFAQLELIEPVELEITLNNNQRYRLQGNFTINRDKLYALRGQALEQLHASGFLEAAMHIANSLNNVQRLIELKNAKNAEQGL